MIGTREFDPPLAERPQSTEWESSALGNQATTAGQNDDLRECKIFVRLTPVGMSQNVYFINVKFLENIYPLFKFYNLKKLGFI